MISQCGIAGFSSFKQDFAESTEKFRRILTEMCGVPVRRKTEETQSVLSAHCALAHTIPSGDKRPGEDTRQCTYVGDAGKQAVISWNGEIYNLEELKRELGHEGIVPDGKRAEDLTASEVLLFGYLRYGIAYIEKTNGVFAISLWDEAKEELYLIRDRLGIKPLFYGVNNDSTIVYSSELKGIFAHPQMQPSLSDEGLCEVLALGPARSCGKAVFDGIKDVLPGHFLRWSRDGLSEHAYWKLKAREHEESWEETVEHCRYLLLDAVKMQTKADAPVCSLLSGGIDSSFVTAVCAEEFRKEGKVLDTFSFEFEGSREYFRANAFQPSLDRPYVDQMAAFAGTNHRYLECGNSQLIENLYRAVDARDLPNMADVESSILYFCSLVSDYSKVALTGECADEIFGGYPWFHKEEALTKDGFPWSTDMETRCCLLKEEWTKRLPLADYAHEAYAASVAETPKLDGEDAISGRRREIACLNLRWFMMTLLERMDRAAMYSGITARVPFADYRIVEYLYNVPWEMKAKDGVPKALLRHAAEGILPEEILWRKKNPYPKTYHPEYERRLGQQLLRILDKKGSPVNEFLDADKVRHFIESPKDYGKPWYGQLMAGPQLLAYWLQMNYWFEKVCKM